MKLEYALRQTDFADFLHDIPGDVLFSKEVAEAYDKNDFAEMGRLLADQLTAALESYEESLADADERVEGRL